MSIGIPDFRRFPAPLLAWPKAVTKLVPSAKADTVFFTFAFPACRPWLDSMTRLRRDSSQARFDREFCNRLMPRER